MTISLCDLPEEILGEICKKLPTVDDVLSLQTAHPRISYKINRVFWRLPKCLFLGADQETEPHLIIEENKKMKFCKPSWKRLQAVLSKARNLKELVFGQCKGYFTEEDLFESLVFLRNNRDVIQLQRIVTFYQNPEGFQQNKNAWPSKKTHDQLCALVRSSTKSLLFLSIGIKDSDKFVSISRNFVKDTKINIQYCHEPKFDSRLAVFHPLLGAFASASGKIKSLAIRMKMAPSMANIILDHCVQACAPAHSNSRLEDITVTFTAMSEGKESTMKEFKNFQNSRNLRSLVWYFDVSLPEEKVEKLCCPVGDCPYDIFVQTPDLKKIYPGIPPNICLNSPKLLQCIS